MSQISPNGQRQPPDRRATGAGRPFAAATLMAVVGRTPLQRMMAAGAAAVLVALSATGWALSARAGQQVAAVSETAPTPETAAPGWRPVAARHGSFDVDAPRWRPLGSSVAVMRRTDGLARELFQFGKPTDGRRYAVVAIDRGEIAAGAPEEDIAGLAEDLEAGAAVRMLGQRLASKFGPLATADVTLDANGGSKACLGFTLRAPAAGLRLTGLVCSGGAEIVSRAEAACFVDRIMAVGLRDPALSQIFVQAELRREPCMGVPAATRVPGVDRGGRPALRTSRL